LDAIVMNKARRGFAWMGLAIASLLLISVPGAVAQDYPVRPITLIMAFPPGGGSDAAARLVSEHMAQTLGQPLVMEPVTGAGGLIGALRAARAAPDGYTLIVHQMALASGVWLFPKIGLNPEKELAPVGLITSSPTVLIGRKGLPVDKLEDLPGWMKANAPIKFAHAGPGTLAHLCAAQFVQAVGAPANLIPYRGGGPANGDLIAGHVDLFFSSLASAIPQIRGGLVKAYGVSEAQPVSALPEVPSLMQLGHKELEVQHWHGIFAPAGTPRPIIDKLNAAFNKVLKEPEVKKWAEDRAIELIQDSTPASAKKFYDDQMAFWDPIIKQSGAKPE
jgi:tripartite-type tricarboxylate transporter receptor subunit TctC